MTIIAAVKKDGLIAIASDTSHLLGNTQQQREDVNNNAKIIEVAGNYIASTGHASISDCLEYYFDKFKDADLTSRRAIFKESLRMHAFFKEELYLSENLTDEEAYFEDMGLDLLIANPTGIFGLYSERSVSEFDKFYAFGTGYRFALGSMYENYPREELDAKAIVERSVQAAVWFDDSCSGECDVRVIKL